MRADDDWNEIVELRQEVELLRTSQKSERVAQYQDHIDNRTRPPLTGMTRMQRRYFLEPWFTTLWVVSWAIGAVLIGVGIWLGEQFVWLGVLFALIGGAAAGAKGWHQCENSRSEGTVIDSPRTDRY